jgi:hypothetical protein
MSAVRILSGYTIFGIWVDDINTLKQAIESHGGRLNADSTAHVPENAEHKFRDPYGIVFDISNARMGRREKVIRNR